jgi:hypothetical protein
MAVVLVTGRRDQVHRFDHQHYKRQAQECRGWTGEHRYATGNDAEGEIDDQSVWLHLQFSLVQLRRFNQ